ncbi:MAG TPA: cobalamin-dependent protein [Anaeromyxobacter sp.]|nr:cobalamin-dependent protein [Anaeromyxobacter sp.]
MRVLLVSLNRTRLPYPVHPIGLDYVAGALTPGHEVQILDLCPLEEGEIERAVAGAVREGGPQVVGISIRNADALDAGRLREMLSGGRRVVEAIRGVSGVKVVLGGAGYTIFPAELLEALGADFGWVGEGELSRALFDALEAGADPAGLPGVVVRGRPAPPPAQIYPAVRRRRASPTLNPALGFYLARGGMLGIQTQRGCRFRCIYCTYPRIEGHALRPFEAEAVAAEARMLEEAGARFLVVTDSVLNGSPEHALSVARAFRQGGLRLPWAAYFTPTVPAPGFYEAMRQAGCTHIEFGTESLADAVLHGLKKPFRRSEALLAHAAALRAGIHVAHFMALGGPGETAETLERTLDGCEELEGAPLFFLVGLRIYPGTELWDLARAAGQIPEGLGPLETIFYEPPEMPLAAIAEAVERRGGRRRTWLLPDRAEQAALVSARLHARGRIGPLWEMLTA